MKALADRVREMQRAMEQVKSTLGNAFVGLVTGAKSLRAALADVLNEFAKMLANRAFQTIWDRGLGSLLGGLFGGGGGGKWWLGGRSFDGGGYTGMGARLGGLDGKGGFLAMLHPNETVIDHTRGQRSGQDLTVHVTMDHASGALGAFVTNQAGKVVAQATPAIVRQAVGATYARAQEFPIGRRN